MNKQKRIEIFTRLREANPNPTTELNYSSPFELLIAVILSAQATDVGVNKATDKLFPVANTPEAILALGVDGLKEYIKTIGLFNSKAENVIKTCRILIEKHGGQVPEHREDLEALPGVGRKTANLTLILGFNKPGICVDIHVHRISNRWGLLVTKTPDETEMRLREILPKRYWKEYNDILVSFGQNCCKPTSPICSECPVDELWAKGDVARHR